MTIQITGNDAQFNKDITILGDLEIYGSIKSKTNDTLFDFSDNFVVKTNETERLRITSGGEVRVPDNARLKFGNGGDLEIFHDGINGVINNNTGDFFIENDLNSTSSDIIHIRARAGENSINAIAGGSIELYHNNAKKLETTSTGVVITGICTATNTAKSYVNFDGTSAGTNKTIRDSHNVSSVVDNGTGVYTVNMITPMSNTNYVVIGSAGQSSSDPFRILGLFNSFTESTFKVCSQFHGGTPYERDCELICCAVFGD